MKIRRLIPDYVVVFTLFDADSFLPFAEENECVCFVFLSAPHNTSIHIYIYIFNIFHLLLNMSEMKFKKKQVNYVSDYFSLTSPKEIVKIGAEESFRRG